MNQSESESNTRQGECGSKAAFRRFTSIAVSCAILLAQPSCIPPVRPPAPVPALPENFTVPKPPPDPNLNSDLPEVFPEEPDEAEGPASSAQLPIEAFYADPVLTGLIHQSVVGNQQLRILTEDVQIARNEVLARSGAYLPFLSLGAGSGLTKVSNYTLAGAGRRDDPFAPGQFFTNPFGDHQFGTQLTWQIDIWWQLHNAKDAAALRLLGTIDGRSYLVTRLVAELADNYYNLLALDMRMQNLDLAVRLQEHSLQVAEDQMEFAHGTALAVQRFRAEVRKNQSEKLIVRQDIIQAENRINFLAGRFPQPVPRMQVDFFNFGLHSLSLGVPPEILLNRPDIRQAERNLEAAGLDIKVARANFLPRLVITGGVGYEAINPAYLLMTPQALVGNVAGGLVAPFVNRRAIKAEYLTANAKQLQAVYDYQRTVINAFTEVVNNMAMVENYGKSIEIKKQQLQSLDAAVRTANDLFFSARTEYLDVLIAQRDLIDARRVLIDTKREQLNAVVNTYQSLGGGAYLAPLPPPAPLQGEHKTHLSHWKWHDKH